MKILILSCGTGGGHNSAALAIQESLLDKGLEADFVEYLDIINSKIKDKINHLYITTTHGSGKVFKTVYHLGELYQKTKLKSPVYQLNFLNRKKLYQYIVENHYDYMITTHLFAAQALTAIKKKHPIHFIAVATDYVCIPFWEETNPDYFVIPSEELESDFIRRGITKEKLLPFGIPVKKAYTNRELDKDEIRNKQCKCHIQNNYDIQSQVEDCEKQKKYVLILTGSMGFGNVTQMVEELLKNIQDISFIIACGNNKKLLESLQSIYAQNKRIVALPFTNNLEQYMKQSEVILTKPGGLTTTEIAVLGKPFIHTMPIPGCENYNANYFSKRGMSIQCHSIFEVVEATKKLLENEEEQKKMVENQRKYMHQDTCDRITDLIIEELKKSKDN